MPVASRLIEIFLTNLYRESSNFEEAEEVFRQEFSYCGPLVLGRVAEVLVGKIGRGKLIGFLSDSVPWEVKPGFSHRSLTLLSLAADKRERPFRIITPNYDTLMERAVGSDCDVIVTEEDYADAHDPRPWVLKIHGCIERDPLQSIVITDSDVAKEMQDWKHDALGVCTRGRGLVVLGYSGGDEHLNEFIWDAIESSDRGTYPSYWVDPGTLSPSVLDRLQDLSGDHVQLGARPFFEQLGLGG